MRTRQRGHAIAPPSRPDARIIAPMASHLSSCDGQRIQAHTSHLCNVSAVCGMTPVQAHISGLFLLATFLDAYAILLVAREVVCVLPMWVPTIDVDLRPSAGHLRIAERFISLEDVKVRRSGMNFYRARHDKCSEAK